MEAARGAVEWNGIPGVVAFRPWRRICVGQGAQEKEMWKMNNQKMGKGEGEKKVKNYNKKYNIINLKSYIRTVSFSEQQFALHDAAV
jgi:hypothetical protein